MYQISISKIIGYIVFGRFSSCIAILIFLNALLSSIHAIFDFHGQTALRKICNAVIHDGAKDECGFLNSHVPLIVVVDSGSIVARVELERAILDAEASHHNTVRILQH